MTSHLRAVRTSTADGKLGPPPRRWTSLTRSCQARRMAPSWSHWRRRLGRQRCETRHYMSGLAPPSSFSTARASSKSFAPKITVVSFSQTVIFEDSFFWEGINPEFHAKYEWFIVPQWILVAEMCTQTSFPLLFRGRFS
ncbi:hypothetical protein GQ53DRAFT_459441 [Thozetella sp. PMI_491]|nr:hypothetical protein GQ53DRAFT_459441 [Thozetella sp. PMI_491]